MPIDSPLDQAASRIAAEQRQADPVRPSLSKALGFAAVIANLMKAQKTGTLGDAIGALSSVVKALSEILGDSNSEYLLSIVIPEVQRLNDRFDQLDERHRRYLDTDWLTLLADADRKARVARGREKVLRIAAILCDSAQKPDQPADESEEMMRVAMNLSDTDVMVLREMALASDRVYPVRGEARGVRGFEMHPWYAINWHGLGLTEHAVESSLGKLYSFGLVAPLNSSDNRPPGNTFSVPINAYELLKKGRDFITWSRPRQN